MPTTFWSFLIGGLALSGFPLVTAGFWSKDEILADAFANGQLLVFVVLALAAFLTAFYTMRQITLTFLGKPRTEAAGHAHESVRTMTTPLIVLSVFAVAAGWAGIPEDFPLLGGVLPNWLHDFVGGTLLEHPHPVEFSPFPLMTSVAVALTGLLLGWVVYRSVSERETDPLARTLGGLYRFIQDKFYFDDLYDFAFARPAYWFAEAFTFHWLDLKIFDGFLHWVGNASLRIGAALRAYIDVPVVNGFGDGVGEGTKVIGRAFRVVQTGRVQQYLIVALTFAGLLLSYFLLTGP